MIALSFITENGQQTAKELLKRLPRCQIVDLRGRGQLREWVENHFHTFSGHVFIMSLGIVYRMIAPFINSKYTDPAVVVVDDARRFAIAALSGHEGGANVLAWKVASLLDCEPVITTASDSNRRITMGVGCRRGVSSETVEKAVREVLDRNNIRIDEVRIAGSVDIKNGESGLIDAFETMGIPLVFLHSNRIRTFSGSVSLSEPAWKHLGLPGVSEPCALLLGRRAVLLQSKIAVDGVTIALAREDEQV